jgi:hypothetical protein
VPSTDGILELVSRALEEFDDRPLEANLRRAVRIATLLGETKTALRFTLELKPTGGSSAANASDLRLLMADPEQWGDPDNDIEAALSQYFGDRFLGDATNERVLAKSIGQMEWWANFYEEQHPPLEGEVLQLHVAEALAQLRIRHRVFVALCGWERQLTFSNVNERIFLRFQAAVDHLIGQGAPDVLDKFNAVYRRLRDAAQTEPEGTTEDLSHALTSCRRILKAVVDHILPAQAEPDEDGHVLDDAKYRNRAKEFTKQVIRGDSYREAVETQIAGLFDRFKALDELANKAVHADVALAEAELCAIQTYVIAGEMLRLSLHRDESGADEGGAQ